MFITSSWKCTGHSHSRAVTDTAVCGTSDPSILRAGVEAFADLNQHCMHTDKHLSQSLILASKPLRLNVWDLLFPDCRTLLDAFTSSALLVVLPERCKDLLQAL
jgi:hypothetical protein